MVEEIGVSTGTMSAIIWIIYYQDWLILIVLVLVAIVFTAPGQSLPWRLWELSSGPSLRQCMICI